jgi:triosephosphate isomerase
VRPSGSEDRPYVAILGGFKVSDKIKVIETLLKKCDKLLIGGAMAYTFKKALGMKVGNSPVEDDQLDYAKRCYEEAKGRIVLPVDSVVTDSFDPKPDRVIKTVKGDIPDGFQGVDIGPETAKLYKPEIAKAKLVFWNGPMGVFEQPEFQEGTKAICEAIRGIKGKAFTVCGGGDSASAVKQFGYKADFSPRVHRRRRLARDDRERWPSPWRRRFEVRKRPCARNYCLGNWKMNKTPAEAKAFALAAGRWSILRRPTAFDVGVAPTFVCLETVKENINPKCIVAAQNVNEHDHGAFTGEVSIAMLKAIGIDWCILGHSERRAYNGETSEACNFKIKALLAAG